MALSKRSGWGHPVDNVGKASATWSLCPELTLPAGVAGKTCDGSTCMVVCEPGKVAMGRRRIKCRWKRSKGFFWKQELPTCSGCDPEDPTAAIADANITAECAVNNLNKNKCTLKCSNGGKIFGRNKAKMTCKCPRVNGVKTCGWTMFKSQLSSAAIAQLTCDGGSDSATAAPAPAGDGTTMASGVTGSASAGDGAVTNANGLTTAAGEVTSAAAGVTTPAATTAAGTTAAPTTVAQREYALSDAEIAMFAPRNNLTPWQFPASCGSTCTEADRTNLVTQVSLMIDPSDDTKELLLFTSNGIPDHNACAGPPNSQILEQNYSYSIPRTPTLKAGTPDSTWESTNFGAIGFALNGVPIFNPYDAECCDAGLYELTSLDACYAHPAPQEGNYHYHVHSPCLAPCTGTSVLIGFALDGFPIMGPGLNPDTNALWSQSDMDECGGKMDADGIYRYYTTVDFPYYLQCYRGETSSTTGGPLTGGTCGLNGTTCSRVPSRKRRSTFTGNRTQDWINSLFELEEPSGYAKRLIGDMASSSRKRRSVTQLTSDVDAYIALWGSEQAVTQQEFLDNLVYDCNSCNLFRDLEDNCNGFMMNCEEQLFSYTDLVSVAAPGGTTGGSSGGSSNGPPSGGPPPGGK